MTSTAARYEEATLTRAALATTFSQPRALVVGGPFRTAVVVAGDVLGAVAIALCLPLAVLAIGIPIALGVRLLLWILGL